MNVRWKMSRSKLPSLKEPVADGTDTPIRKGAPSKPRKKKIYCGMDIFTDATHNASRVYRQKLCSEL